MRIAERKRERGSRYERSTIMAQTKAKIASRKECGLCVGPPPFGFKNVEGNDGVKRVFENPLEQEILGRVKRWREAGYSITQIVTLCREAGITTRQGTHPSSTLISRWIKGVKVIEPSKVTPKKRETPRFKLEEKVTGLSDAIFSFRKQGLSYRGVADAVYEADERFRTSKGGKIHFTHIRVIAKRSET